MKKFELAEIIIILALVGVGVYFLWKHISGAITSITNDPANLDPGTGESNGIFNGLNNVLIPQAFPGGGSVAGSSESYTGAASTVVTSPFDSAVSILGGNPSAGSSWDKIKSIWGG